MKRIPLRRSARLDGSKEYPISIVLVGDVMLGRLVDQMLPYPIKDLKEQRAAHSLLGPVKRRHYAYPWSDLLPLFERSKAHVRLANLETTITRSTDKWPEKAFNFKVSPENAYALCAANMDVVSLANNHILDFKTQGMVDTMKTLDSYGILRSGCGLNLNAVRQPAIMKLKLAPEVEATMGFVSFTDHPTEWAAKSDRAGVNFADPAVLGPTQRTQLSRYLLGVRTKYKIDVLVLSYHWGPNWAWTPSTAIKNMAHFLVDECGVDVIHGTSSHHIQGIEVYRGKPIFYGCGDFVDDYAVDRHYRNDLTFLYQLTLLWQPAARRVRFESLHLVPCQIGSMSVHRATKSGTDWLFHTANRLCKEFAAIVRKGTDGRLEYIPNNKHVDYRLQKFATYRK